MSQSEITKYKENLFFADISRILAEGRKKVRAAVNFTMVETYWNIGKRIVEQEQQGKERANYGEQLLVNLSRYLSETFGKGFSVANLWNFRQFYLTWANEQILYTLCRELSWSHIRLIMRLDSEKAREYYLNETRTQNWSVRMLERNIRTGYFERLFIFAKTDASGKRARIQAYCRGFHKRSVCS
jgi:hypothetical protein